MEIGWTLACFDAETGEVVGSVNLDFPEKLQVFRLGLSPDRKTLLIEAGRPFMGMSLFGRCAVSVVDGHPFSPDGQWLCVQGGLDAVEVIECCSGKTILTLRELESKGKPVDACFAPDSSALAVCFGTNGRQNSHFLKIFALSGGQERCRLNLPGADRWRLINWESNRVFAQAIERDDSAAVIRRGYSFAFGTDSKVEGRLEALWTGYATPATREEYWDSYWVDGPGWVAHSIVAPYQKTGIDKRLEWLGKKIGVEFELNDHLHETIRFLDPDTGQVRFELPSQLSYLCTISEDGKRVACLHPKHGLELWNAQEPRWPWSAAAGFAAAGGMLLFGRWRTRREMKRQIRP